MKKLAEEDKKNTDKDDDKDVRIPKNPADEYR